MKRYNRVLSIAGSDSGGGAGIQADIKTITALGCYASTAITAVTVQNTVGVEAVHPVPVDIIRGQIEAVLSDIGADAVKTGMLHSAETVLAVSQMLRKHKVSNLVIDPVMVSTSGHQLLEEDAVASLQADLIPLARVITPNIPEAEILLGGKRLNSQEDLPDAARRLASRYSARLDTFPMTNSRTTSTTQRQANCLSCPQREYRHETPTARDARFPRPWPHAWLKA